MSRNILICDANHGGLVLLDEYSKYTSNNLFFYDIYAKLSDEEKRDYSNKYDVTFLANEDIEDKNYINDNFISIAPVHMNPIINKDYTHHEFTSYLVNKHRQRHSWNFKIIQVTGVKAKTTVSSMIRDILNDYNILLLNSTELSYNSNNEKKVLADNLSITPASIITALNIAMENELLDKVDYFICEVSLGVIPHESIGVLTNIIEDYPIANNTFNASSAKASVFTCDEVICQKESFDKFYNNEDRKVMKISLYDEDSFLYVKNLKLDVSNTSFTICHDNKEYYVTCFALTDYYVLNILFAVGVGLLCNMTMEEAISKISDIGSINGRTSYKRIGEKIIIEEINPGLNTSSIKKSIDNIKALDENFNIILGGDYGITCEEIDESKLTDYLRLLDKRVVLTGQLGHNLKRQLSSDNFTYSSSLNITLQNMLKDENTNIIMVIYRSEYAKKVKLDII
jgi:UDP-N-acetylmuramyl pentapeptide synthase